jgi:putative methyltransferase (TIGR04325 family)
MFKYYLKLILPNFIIVIINKLLKRNIRFVGNYRSWKDAAYNSLGYDHKKIFLKSKESFLKVINKKARYERDTVLFYSEAVNYPLMNMLKNIQKKKKTCLNVLDFGGSFGSVYFQNYTILKNKNKFNWSIVEQNKIVKYAKKFNLENNLSFYSSINNYMIKYNPDVVLFSSVIHYLKYPNKIINYFIKKKIKNILFLKTPFSTSEELIKVQIVPKHIYDASYPIRIFNEHSFLKLFRDNNYKVVTDFLPNEKIDNISFKNFIFKLNNYTN